MLYNIERPHRFDEVVGQRDIVTNIQSQSKNNDFFSFYIFRGQYGVGKTTMARIISLASNCNHKDKEGNPCLECSSCKAILSEQAVDVLEIDAATNTGVDSIRDLKDSTTYLPVNLNRKIYIIDEVHMLSKGAFNSLLKLLEEPPKHAIFILCTTDINAIPVTVRSRAAIYIFEQLSFEDIKGHLLDVSKRHNINVSEDAVSLIAKNSHGSLRNALSLLEQLSKVGDNIEVEDVARMLGISDPKHIFELLGYILESDTGNCISSIEKIVSLGKDLFFLVSDMLDICADGVVACCKKNIDSICNTQNYKEMLFAQIKKYNKEQFCSVATNLMVIRDELRKMPSKTTLVVGVIRMTHDAEVVSNKVLERLAYLESVIKDKNFIVAKESVPLKEDSLIDSSTNFINLASKMQENNQYEGSVVNPTESYVASKIEEKETCREDKKTESQEVDSFAETLEDKGSVDEEMKEVKEEKSVPTDKKEESKDEKVVEDLSLFDMLDLFAGEPEGPSQDKVVFDEKKPLEGTEISSAEPKEEKLEDSTCVEFDYDSKDTDICPTTNSSLIEDQGIHNLKNIDGFLADLYTGDALIETLIEMGCTKVVVGDEVVLKTEIEPVYTVIDAYIKAQSLPFTVQYIAMR